MVMNKYKNIALELIVTCFFIGKIKYAPGTFGSLLAFPINYLLVALVLKSRSVIPLAGLSEGEREFVTVLVSMLLAVVILSIIAVMLSNVYMIRTGKHDPKEIVIDEVVGQMLTSSLTFFSVAFVYRSPVFEGINPTLLDFVCFFLMPFILFRACDIIKPWPIGWIDRNIKSGFGVVLDDIVAGILAAVLQLAIILSVV